MTTDMSGRTALVTGSGKADGIGAAIARRLAASGASVVVHDVEEQHDSLQTLLASLGPGAGGAVVGDLRLEADVQRLTAEAFDLLGRIDILVNNAAAPIGADRQPIDQVPIEAWDLQTQVNLRGPFLMCRALVPSMRERGFGRIVNMASILAHVGRAGRTAYASTKTAMLGFTRTLALEVAASGVTVNAVCPGRISTSRQRVSAGLVGEDIQAELAHRASKVPVGRLGTPDDVAAAVCFLASTDAGYITGQSLTVDGGLTVGLQLGG